MTKREMFEAVINNEVTPEVVEGFRAELKKMDDANAKRAEKRSEKSKANEPIKANIANAIEGRMTASEIGEKLELSTQKVSALCRQMVESGVLKVEDIKVKGKGKRKAYSLA